MAPIQVYGEFNITASLARRVHRAVEEFTSRSTLVELSHEGDDCALCQSAGVAEIRHDAPQPDRASRQRIA